VKIAPDLDDAELEDLLSVVEEVGIAGVVAANTTSAGLVTDAGASKRRRGPGVRRCGARAVEVVRRVRARQDHVVVIGSAASSAPSTRCR
jgi:dihydroorotate dehydrogenase